MPINTNIILQPLRQSDFDELIDVAKKTFNETYPGCFTQEELDAKFNDKFLRNDITIIAKLDNEIIGYAKLSLQKTNAFLDKLYVLNEYKNQGCGYLLLKRCYEYAVLNQKTTLALYVYSANTVARIFYEKQGFQVGSINKR